MTNEEYYQNIYKIKEEIDAFDDAFWGNDNCTDEEVETYEARRQILLDKLEAAYKA